MNPFMKMIQNYNDKRFNRTDKTYTFPNGSTVYFMSADTESKFVGLSSDYVLLDEANLYQEGESILQQLAMRCRKALILTFNPSRRIEYIEVLKERKDTVYIHSTYKDNPFLEQTVVDEIEERAKRDKRFAAVYRDGRYMADSERAIFNNWEVTREWPDNYKWNAWGMDFGFSNDPTTLIETLWFNDKLWIRGHLYKTGLTTTDIFLAVRDTMSTDAIAADNSEPRLIQELSQRGINIFPIRKYPGHKLDGIRALQNVDIMVYYDDKDLIRELEDYQWRKRSGVIIDEPLDKDDHYMDALIYATRDKLRIAFGAYSYK